MLEEQVREVEVRAQQTIDDERRKRREFMVSSTRDVTALAASVRGE